MPYHVRLEFDYESAEPLQQSIQSYDELSRYLAHIPYLLASRATDAITVRVWAEDLQQTPLFTK